MISDFFSKVAVLVYWRETGKKIPNVPKNGWKIKRGRDSLYDSGSRFLLFLFPYPNDSADFWKNSTLQFVPRYMHNDIKENSFYTRKRLTVSQYISILIEYICFFVFCVFAKAVTLSSFRATGVYTPWLKWYIQTTVYLLAFNDCDDFRFLLLDLMAYQFLLLGFKSEDQKNIIV